MKAIKNLIPFVSTEKKALKSLVTIVGLRMLGLFMLLPVLALYAENFTEATPTLIGIAIGIYGLTQAILQIPFGLVSDKIGRKKVIVFGLLIFALGSVISALSDSIYLLIFGRALQGAGAISAVSMALLADLTREEVRVRAMATMGISIGFSFILAIVLGPFLSGFIGVNGIFWLTAVLALLAILIVIFKVPDIKQSIHLDTETAPNQLLSIIKNTQLLRLDFGIFSLHLSLSATFVAIPIILKNHLNFSVDHHGLLYLGVMIVAVLIMLPLVMMAESKNKMKPIFIFAILLLAFSQLGFYFLNNGVVLIAITLTMFFVAFNLLESLLPSLISKIAPVNAKGTAMGIYSSSQFFGVFVGGFFSGWLIEYTNNYFSAFIMSFVVLVIWLFVAIGVKLSNALGTMLLKVGTLSQSLADDLSKELLRIRGVKEVTISDGVAFIRVDNKNIDRKTLLTYSKNKLNI